MQNHLPRAAAFLIGLAVASQALSGHVGGVIVKGGEIRWGQYASVPSIVAVEFPRGSKKPADSLPHRIKEYPLSGASSILLKLQGYDERFFSKDGKSIDPEELTRLREELDAINRFDMLPIILMFQPIPDNRLESDEAYVEAAKTLVRGLGDDFWYLLSVSDACDPSHWNGGENPIDMVETAKRIAAAVKKMRPFQVIAAGGTSLKTNEKLAAGGSSIDALMSGGMINESNQIFPRSRHPKITVTMAKGVGEDQWKKALKKAGIYRVDNDFSWGVAFDFGRDIREYRIGGVAPVLELLAKETDRFQKETLGASPLDPSDAVLLHPEEKKEGFVSLFNGRDLSGWVPLCRPGNFEVEEGSIQTSKFEGGWLRSWDVYQDFVFRGEFWIEEGGNSGFYIRAPLSGRQSRIAFEVQIHGQSADIEPNKDSCIAIYDVRAPEGNFMRENQWNEIEISCIGSEVKIVWNGEVAHRFRYEEEEFMKNRAIKGYIGLQDHYDVVKFRNLRIKELER